MYANSVMLYTGTMNVLFVSNGHGEDLIAYELAKTLKRQFPDVKITPFPLVGKGLAYQEFLEGETQNPIFPSGGFLRTLKDIVKDIKAGLIMHTFHQQKALRQLAKLSDLTICVGDIFCLLMGKLGNASPSVFLPTAKSNLFMPHGFIEKHLMKQYADLIFTRDEETADDLKKSHLPALYLGNPIMDQLSEIKGSTTDSKQNENSALPKETIVCLLPGSREEAYLNLNHMLDVASNLQDLDKSIKFVLIKAETMSLGKWEKKGWILQEKSHFSFLTNGITKVFISEKFKESIPHANVVLGLAGTANEQAVYLGKTVFCFEGFGPQSTEKRFKEQEKLLGKGLRFLKDKDPIMVAKALKTYLENPLPNEKLEFENASEKIVECIIKTLTPYWAK